MSLGQGRALNELQVFRADATTVSTPTLQATSIRSCKSRVFAAEAKKAESASEDTRRIPRPPLKIGKLAWSQSLRQELVMTEIPSCNRVVSKQKRMVDA